MFKEKNMNLINSTSQTVEITLKEITDLLEVRHDKAMLKVEALTKEPSFGEVSKTDTFNLNGVKVITYRLNKKQAIAVGARLNNSLLMKLIDKLEELQSSKNNPALLSRRELALMVIEQEERIEELERTKSYISDKKTATAMNTASQAVKKVKTLEIELDKSKEYCTIKRMSMLTHGQKYSFKLLREISAEMGIQPIDVFDANYGTVKAYHKNAWVESYGLEF